METDQGLISNYEQPKEERVQAHSFTSKRHHSESPSAWTSTEKCSPDETLFTWLTNDEADTTVLTASQELIIYFSGLIGECV